MSDIDWSQVDSYEWLVEVWIPLALGVATVVVAVAAVHASNRAGDLAEKVEAVRTEEEIRRREMDKRSRILDMSRDEARLLWRWTSLKINPMSMYGGYPTAERDEGTARLEAEGALTHSFVPGGADIGH